MKSHKKSVKACKGSFGVKWINRCDVDGLYGWAWRSPQFLAASLR